MARRRREPTFCEIVGEARARPPRPTRRIVPGTINADGHLYGPGRDLLTRVKAQITPAQARSFVDAGALVAYEGCGCGGWYGCAPSWFVPDELPAGVRPRLVKGFGSPTWIDLWESDVSVVVFLHGDVEWGEALSWT